MKHHLYVQFLCKVNNLVEKAHFRHNPLQMMVLENLSPVDPQALYVQHVFFPNRTISNGIEDFYL